MRTNTAVRSLLTKIGEYYLKKVLTLPQVMEKKNGERIKYDVFNNKCAYCNADDQKLQIEHLIMFNRTEYGLHHPEMLYLPAVNCKKGIKWTTINIQTGKST